jgi:competence protein ComEC
VLPDPEASLLSGILLGIESGIQPDVRKAFNDTGTSHIIAISGFNITIIAALFSKLFGRFLGRRWGATACALGIALYTILAGADASVVRAALMAGIALLGQRIGRQAFSLASLAASAMLMTALQPMALWDVGFQLSFAATLGLVLYGPPLEAWLERLASRWIRPRRARRLSRTISEFTLFTLAAQVTTLPLIAYYFRRLSLVSLLANPVILPLQPAVMVLGGLAVLGGMLFLPLGRLLGWVAWPFVALTIRAVEFFAQWPLRVIPLGRVGLLGVAAFYLLLAGFTLWAHLPAERRPSWSKLRIPATAALAALLIVTGLTWKAIMQRPDGRLHIYLLDVGSGDAVLIQSPSGRFVLIDGGPSPVALSEALGRRLPLLQRRIDWLVVGASADDYVSGLAGIAERFPIGSVLLSGDPGRSPYRRLMQELYSARIPIQHASEGHALDLGEGASLQVEALGSRGAVLLLRHGNFSMLLAPGADPEMMQGLSHQSDLGPCTVLLLADSGFAAVNPTAWLQGTRPLLALISVEGGNKEGLPSPQVLQSLQDTNLLRTDLHGWIALHSDGQQLWVEVERLPPSAPLGATLPTP